MDYTGQSLEYDRDGPPPPLPDQPLDTDFAKRFPPDPTLGDELGETARVWKVYRAEAEAHNNTMLDGWNKTLDVLLIFAGLFSAVATAFLIDSYKLLKPDNSAAYMSTALYLLVLRDNATSTIPLPPPPPLATTASAISQAVNWLWFTSLLLSLSVALLGILIKQWIVEYSARNTASAQSPRDWAIRHRMFFHAMITWPVADLVSVLPAMLHAALFLFFCGLALFVWDLNLAIGIWITVLGFVLGGFYVACSLLPLWISDCPTATPLVQLIRRFFFGTLILALQLCNFTLSQATQSHTSILRRFRGASQRDSRTELDGWLWNDVPTTWSSRALQKMKSNILNLRTRQQTPLSSGLQKKRVTALEADALRWLIYSVADSDSRAVGLQALGALRSNSALSKNLIRDDRLTRFHETAASTGSASGAINPVEAARVARSILWSRSSPTGRWEFMQRRDIEAAIRAFSDVDYPDFVFLTAVFWDWQWQRDDLVALYSLPRSPSLTRTVLLVLGVHSFAWHMDYIDLLHAISLCSFGDLDDADWAILLAKLVHATSESSSRVMQRLPPMGAGGIALLAPVMSTSFSTDPTLRILPVTRPLVMFLDALAQCALQDRSVQHRLIASRLILEIIAALKSERNAGTHICNHSFVWVYLASTAFTLRRFNDHAHRIILDFLERSAYNCPSKDILYFSSVFFNVLLSIRHDQGPTDTSFPLWIYFRLLEGSLLNRAPRQEQTALRLFLLHEIFDPHPPFGFSPWDRIQATSLTADIAPRLAQVLCVEERFGGNVSVMVDIFLSRLSLQDLTFATINDIVSGRADWSHLEALCHAVNHCVELRPTWWMDSVLRIAIAEPRNERLMECAHRITASLASSGPCILCPGIPLAWNDGNLPPSLCAFNPAVVTVPIDDVESTQSERQLGPYGWL